MAENKAPAGGNYTGKIVVDPVTRLEGHLRIEVEVEGGKVKKAYSCGTLFRGLEIILKGRDPRDAQHITQRACGVCTFTHALASARAVDDAVGVELPPLGRMLRDLVLGSQFMHDHVVHFYHLHALDFVNVADALKADPKKAASISGRDKPEELKAVQERLKKFVESGQLGPFTNAYFLGDPHPAYKLNPEMNLICTAHYLKALALQVKAARAMAVIGGKNPHPQFMVVGGVTCYNFLQPDKIKEYIELEKETIDFIKNYYIPDLLAVAAEYKDVAGYGGTTNFITFGEFCKDPNKRDTGFFAPGIIRKRDLKNIEAFDPKKIAEHVRHSWYKGAEAHHPYDGVTEPAFTDLHGDDRYSWSKAPRYDTEPMETGPLAQILVNYAKGNKAVVKYVDLVLKTLGVGPEALFSTLGRTAARGIETAVIADQMDTWIKEFQEQLKKEGKDAKLVAKSEMPKKAEGVGFVNAPRGGLSHWIRIEDGKIANFQLVVPTTWNMSPRCAADKIGPIEEALTGMPIVDAKRPVEILRTVHSFDPCIACAVHVIDPESNETRVFKVL